MGYPLYCVLNGMRKIVHGIYAPLIARLMVAYVLYTVYGGVTHIEVGACHIYLCAERMGTVLKLTVFHSLEKVEILLNAALSPRAVFAGFGQRAAVLSHLILIKIAHIRLFVADKLHGKLVARVEI